MFIQRPDAQLHTLSFGQGPLTLLAIGGWTAGGEIWHALFGHLADWRCVSLDHRGAGASMHSGPITVDAMADDLLAVADAVGASRCVIASESSGAAVALQAIARAPGRFVGQVLVGAAWERTEPGASDGLVGSLRRDYPGTLRSFIDNCLPETDSVVLRRWALQMMMRAGVDDAVDLLRCREQTGLAHAATGHTLPALLVHGDQDRIVPVQSSRELAAHLPRAELHVLPGLGHVPICTAPAQVAALVDDFGKRLG
ncbi:MAG: alpha/beta hydrolase [Rhodoferax sp.]|jgi:pimeloyl-ACP methyl ester carboxylesterase|nr:alpha/beta hydrolase [Rhodoferax sp.]